MKLRYLTEKGRNLFDEAIYYELDEFYDPMVGNFGFTELELYKNLEKIKLWLKFHSDYKLLYQNNECSDDASEELVWWLTNFE